MRHIAISDPLASLRAEVQALASIETSNIKALPIACGAWRRERADAAREAYETVLRLINQSIQAREK